MIEDPEEEDLTRMIHSGIRTTDWETFFLPWAELDEWLTKPAGANHIERECAGCGKPFMAQWSYHRKDWRKFCSRRCVANAERRRIRAMIETHEDPWE